ncbi:MAG: tetratricopeptide repeat protein [Clostridiales bacterium]|nr:tetratricopeptide repeat protein [Clostridiales bacterium]
MGLIGKTLLLIFLVIIIVKRASIVALFAKYKYSKGDYYGALKIFNVADKVGNLGVGDKILYGYNCLRCGELEKAKKAFDIAYMITKPETADRFRVRSLQALLAWKQDDLETAIEYLEEVYSADFKNTNLYQNLGIMYNLSGDYEKALEFNKEAYEYNSDDNIIVDNLADTYSLMGNYEEAEKVYVDLVNRDPEPRFPEAFYGYGEVLIKLGKREEGIEMIEKSLTKPFSFLSLRPKEEIEAMLESYKND